jgi:hypothetical protein
MPGSWPRRRDTSPPSANFIDVLEPDDLTALRRIGVAVAASIDRSAAGISG